MISSVSDLRANPTVTVVIPAYNASSYITQALDSLYAQTFRDYEVIIVNDGSTDADSLERIVHGHPLPVIYLSQPNRGVSAARNAALKVARGKFYAQLDADDQWLPEYLEMQVGILEQNSHITLVYPNATIIADNTSEQLEFMSVSPSEGEVTFESLIRQECTVMTCVTARMSAIKDAGMFDEDLRSCEDFDMWLRIIRNGGFISYHRRILVLYRRHPGSLSSDRVWMTRNLLAVFSKCANTFDLTSAERQILDEQIDRNRALLRLFEGKHALRDGGASTALICFKEANEHLRSPKLLLVIFLLRHVPHFVVWSFVVRERFWLSHSDYQLTGIDNPQTAEALEPRR